MTVSKKPVTVDDLFRLRTILSLTVSPDGTLVVFSMQRSDLEQNRNCAHLYAVDDRGGRIRQLTAGAQMDRLPRFAPDGQWVAFLSDREKPCGLWLLPMAGGEPVRLTGRDLHVRAFDWAPDSRRLVISARYLSEREQRERDSNAETPARHPTFRRITRLHYRDDGSGFREDTWYHLFIVSRQGGRLRQLTGIACDHAEPVWAPDGDRIAFLANRLPDPDRNPNHQDIFALSPDTGRERTISTVRGFKKGLAWSPDGACLAYAGNRAGPGELFRHNVHIWVQPAAGGRAKNITPALDYNCMNLVLGDVTSTAFEPEPPLWAGGGAYLYFPVSRAGACRLYRADRQGKEAREIIGGDCVLCGATRTATTGPAALIHGDALNPGDIAVFDPENPSGKPRRITTVNRTVLGRRRLAIPEPVSCRRGRTTIHGWMLKPPYSVRPACAAGG